MVNMFAVSYTFDSLQHQMQSQALFALYLACFVACDAGEIVMAGGRKREDVKIAALRVVSTTS